MNRIAIFFLFCGIHYGFAWEANTLATLRHQAPYYLKKEEKKALGHFNAAAADFENIHGMILEHSDSWTRLRLQNAIILSVSGEIYAIKNTAILPSGVETYQIVVPCKQNNFCYTIVSQKSIRRTIWVKTPDLREWKNLETFKRIPHAQDPLFPGSFVTITESSTPPLLQPIDESHTLQKKWNEQKFLGDRDHKFRIRFDSKKIIRPEKETRLAFLNPSDHANFLANRPIQIISVIQNTWAVVHINPPTSPIKNEMVIYFPEIFSDPLYGRVFEVLEKNNDQLTVSNIPINMRQERYPEDERTRQTKVSPKGVTDIIAIPLHALMHYPNNRPVPLSPIPAKWSALAKNPALPLSPTEEKDVISYISQIISQALTPESAEINRREKIIPKDIGAAIYKASKCFSSEELPISSQMLLAQIFETSRFASPSDPKQPCGLMHAGYLAKLEVVSSYFPKPADEGESPEALKEKYPDYMKLKEQPGSCISEVIPPINWSSNGDWCQLENNISYGVAYFRFMLSRFLETQKNRFLDLPKEDLNGFFQLGWLAYKTGFASIEKTLTRLEKHRELSREEFMQLFTTISQKTFANLKNEEALIPTIRFYYRKGLTEYLKRDGAYIGTLPFTLNVDKMLADNQKPMSGLPSDKSDAEIIKTVYLRALLTVLVTRMNKHGYFDMEDIEALLKPYHIPVDPMLGVILSGMGFRNDQRFHGTNDLVIDAGDPQLRIPSGIKRLLEAIVDTAIAEQPHRLDVESMARYPYRIGIYQKLLENHITHLLDFINYPTQKEWVDSVAEMHYKVF